MTEIDYWNSIRDGSNEAFRQLYNKYADMLYRYGMKIAQDSGIVEDAIQTVFLNIFEKRKSLSRPNSIPAYLYASLRNEILCGFRANKLLTIPLEEEFFSKNGRDDYNFKLEIDPCTLLELDEEEREKQKMLQQILDSLSGKHREIIYLRYYKGLSVEEVASIFNTNNQQIYKAVSRIIKKLREQNVYSKAFIAFIISIQNW